MASLELPPHLVVLVVVDVLALLLGLLEFLGREMLAAQALLQAACILQVVVVVVPVRLVLPQVQMAEMAVQD